MMKTKRFAFDTNVVISAACFEHSKPAKVFFHALRHGVVLASPAVLNEWHTVLRRKKFDAYLSVLSRERFLDQITLAVNIVEIHERIHVCRDPRDDIILELAASGKADYLITGDADLLVLHPFRSSSILTPDQFLSLLQSEEAAE